MHLRTVKKKKKRKPLCCRVSRKAIDGSRQRDTAWPSDGWQQIISSCSPPFSALQRWYFFLVRRGFLPTSFPVLSGEKKDKNSPPVLRKSITRCFSHFKNVCTCVGIPNTRRVMVG